MKQFDFRLSFNNTHYKFFFKKYSHNFLLLNHFSFFRQTCPTRQGIPSSLAIFAEVYEFKCFKSIEPALKCL